MQEFLIENIISIISVLVAIILPIIIYTLQKNRKLLSYEVISSTSLIVKDAEISKKIKIIFNDTELKDDTYLVLIKIVNNGNVPVKEIDFSDNLRIDTESEILSVELKETNPDNLKYSVTFERNMLEIFNIVEIYPLLLNSKDEIIIKMLVKSYKDDIKVVGRIAGIKEIKKIKDKKSLFYVSIILNILLTLTSLGMVLWEFELLKSTSLTIILIVGGLSSLIVTWLRIR